jgi:hypothetical protein
MSSVKTDEITGGYYLSVINGKYMINKTSDEHKPEYLTWDGKLEASAEVRDFIKDSFYELSEMGKTFLASEYSGNISEETLGNLIKGALDRANRELNDFWYEIRKSLYVLCKLNHINVSLEDINIDFNIGRVDDPKTLAETCEILSGMKLFSNETLLMKYWGYSSDDAEAEAERIKQENKEDDQGEDVGTA